MEHKKFLLKTFNAKVSSNFEYTQKYIFETIVSNIKLI